MTTNTDRPWMTALEMQFAALRACYTAPPSVTADGFNHERAIELLTSAEAYAWSSECATAVMLASQTIRYDTCLAREMLPTANGWWWLDKPIGEIRGIAWGVGPGIGPGPNFISVSSFGYASPEILIPIEFHTFSWRFNTSIETLLNSSIPERKFSDSELIEAKQTLVAMSRFLLAGFAWLQQRVLTFSSGHIERHRRKQLAREHNAPLPSDVKVIQLRRAESQTRPPSTSGEPVEWSCRWIVNGHWRNQPYKDERKLIYIMPYVKGPDDMPLKVPTHTVYQVSR